MGTLFLELDRADRPRSDSRAPSESLSDYCYYYYYIFSKEIVCDLMKKPNKNHHEASVGAFVAGGDSSASFGRVSHEASRAGFRKNELIKIIRGRAR